MSKRNRHSNANKNANNSNGRKPKNEQLTINKEVTNDFQWWNKYPKLASDASEFPFNQIQGTEFMLEGFDHCLPSVAVYHYLPTIGRSVDADSPFMTQIRDLWLDMHRKFRGIGSYEVADLGMFIFCCINLFANIARAEKIYGYYRNANVENRNIPYTLLQAMEVEYTDNAKRLANFRMAIDEINQKASKLLLPKGFAAYEDAVVLATATVKDSESVRANMYTFDSPYFYVFDGTTYQTGSAAVARSRRATGLGPTQTLENIIDDLRDQIAPLQGRTDCQIMASDILAVYGENGVETRQGLDEAYLSPIAKDDVRLLQIHNCTVCGGMDSASHLWEPRNIHPIDAVGTMQAPYLDICQANGILYEDIFVDNTNITQAWITIDQAYQTANPNLAIKSLGTNGYEIRYGKGTNHYGSCPVQCFDRVLDTWSESISNEEKMEMTRFTVPASLRYATDGTTTFDYVHLDSFGTNIIIDCLIWSRQANAGLSPADFRFESLGQGSSNSNIPKKFAELSNFDWHHICYFGSYDAWTTANQGYPNHRTGSMNYALYGDLDHSTVVKDSSLAIQMTHNAALMSAYKCELSSTSKIETL